MKLKSKGALLLALLSLASHVSASDKASSHECSPLENLPQSPTGNSPTENRRKSQQARAELTAAEPAESAPEDDAFFEFEQKEPVQKSLSSHSSPQRHADEVTEIEARKQSSLPKDLSPLQFGDEDLGDGTIRKASLPHNPPKQQPDLDEVEIFEHQPEGQEDNTKDADLKGQPDGNADDDLRKSRSSPPAPFAPQPRKPPGVVRQTLSRCAEFIKAHKIVAACILGAVVYTIHYLVGSSATNIVVAEGELANVCGGVSGLFSNLACRISNAWPSGPISPAAAEDYHFCDNAASMETCRQRNSGSEDPHLNPVPPSVHNPETLPDGGQSNNPQVQLPTDPQVQLPTDPQVQLPTDPRVQPQIDPQVQPQIEPQVQPQIEPQVQPQIEPQVQPQVEPQAQPLSINSLTGNSPILQAPQPGDHNQ